MRNRSERMNLSTRTSMNDGNCIIKGFNDNNAIEYLPNLSSITSIGKKNS